MKEKIKETYLKLKSESGSHSPSIETLLEIIGESTLKHDFCFLSNPLATGIFKSELDDLIKDKLKWNRTVEAYPPQNRAIASYLSQVLKVNQENIIIGNGAVEIIQMVLHKYVKENIMIILPTFSPYYEYLNDTIRIEYFHLKKENDFQLNTGELISQCRDKGIKNLVLINPNNPTGTYMPRKEVLNLFSELKELDNIIIDESFIDFAYEGEFEANLSTVNHIKDYPNVILVKSMSKDFGIAGIRCGYGIMNKEKVDELLETGYLWNISGLGSFFFKTLSRPDFIEKYKKVKVEYLKTTIKFFENLIKIGNTHSNKIRVYPSNANFILIEGLNGITSEYLTINLLAEHGLYVRDCNDKIGLEGDFIRVAARTQKENEYFLNSLNSLLL